MMEAIGLIRYDRTPLVIVDTQRGGPSTGLPTKQEQSDLMAMIYGTHGKFRKLLSHHVQWKKLFMIHSSI